MIGATRRSRGSSSLKDTRFFRVVGHFGLAPPEGLAPLLVDAFESLEDLVRLGDLLEVEDLEALEEDGVEDEIEDVVVVTDVMELDVTLVRGDAGGREKFRSLPTTLLVV